jgi:hypothetical protein
VIESGKFRGTTASASRLDDTPIPPTTAARRTRVGDVPVIIKRSEIHPVRTVEVAINRNTAEVSLDIEAIDIFSSPTR